MLRSVKSSQRNVRALHFKVTGTGTAAINVGASDATLTDNGTGDYTLTLAKPAKRLLSCVVSPVGDAGDVIATVRSTSSASAVRILCWDGTDGTTAKDAVFFASVFVSDAADET